MDTEMEKNDETKLKIVFENKNSGSHFFDESSSFIKKKSLYTERAVIDKRYTKFDEIWAESQAPTEFEVQRLQDMAIALREANERENLGTEKFLREVESMVTVFKPELDKMQELFGSILKKLPLAPNVAEPEN